MVRRGYGKGAFHSLARSAGCLATRDGEGNKRANNMARKMGGGYLPVAGTNPSHLVMRCRLLYRAEHFRSCEYQSFRRLSAPDFEEAGRLHRSRTGVNQSL